MTGTTSVPSIQWTLTGIVLPAESSILAGVQADMNAAAGGGLSTSLTSPQGQLAQSTTAIIGDKNNNIANIVNQVDPDQADGRFQDAIGRIYFIDRLPGVGTIVTAQVTGLTGTVIPLGALAQDINGNVYQCTQAVTIDNTGTVNATFQCITFGPIVCNAGQLTKIYKAIVGWDRITNAANGITGTNVETRADFESRRRNSVAINAVNSPQSIFAAVLSVPGVLDAYVIDNPTSSTVNTGSTNYPVVANSVYVAVAGGSATAIAQAIWSKKSLGCVYNGSTTQTVTDNNYNNPKPTYTVKWQTPTNTPTYFSVNIANNPNLPANIVTLVQNAVIASFTGADGGQRARIGGTQYASRYVPGVGAVDPNVQINSIFIGNSANPTSGTALTAGIDQIPTIAASQIAVNLV